MSYIITRTNGDLLLENGLPENTIDTKTVPVALIGKLIADYGTYQSNNFVHLLENFANSSEPENPINGMIWFNTTDNTVYVCVEETTHEWRKFAFIQTTPPANPDTGDLYYNPETHKFYIYDSGLLDWVFIGPVDVGSIIEGTDELISDSSGTFICNIPLPTEATCNIDIKLIGREILDTSVLGLRLPECGTWNIQCCASSYIFESGGISSTVYDLVNQPFVQKIAATDIADKWDINLEANNTTASLQIKINASGIKTPAGFGGSVKWKVYYKMIKVA